MIKHTPPSFYTFFTLRRFLRILGLFSIILVLNACSSNTVNNLTHTAKSIKSRSVVVIPLTAAQSLSSITPLLAKHRVVFVGEVHTNYGDHLNQLAVIKNLHQIWGKQLSIGLEMIQAPYQQYLDAYILGEINERDMLFYTQWYDRWRYDFRLYRPIFDYAKKYTIPLIALNIPKELTRRITKVGIKGLNSKERNQLPPTIDKSNLKYNARITKVFRQHSQTSSKGVDKFLDAQLAWDEGMAFNAARFLKKNTLHKMVIIAGGGHVINRDGIPDRLERMIKSKPATLLNHVQGNPDSKQGDFLLFSSESELPTSGLIGIHMNATDDNTGIIVEALTHHGAAKKAGIQQKDLIVRIDNQVIKAIVDVKLVLEDKKPDDIIKIQIKRKGAFVALRVELGSRQKTNPH